MTDERLDQVLAQMKAEEPGNAEAAAAHDAVWQRLTAKAGCAEFAVHLPDYVAGTLPEARRLLVDDHLSRCVHCRNAFLKDSGRDDIGQNRVVVIAAPRRRPTFTRWMGWAAAASLAAVSLYAGRDQIDRALAPGGPRAHLENASGTVFRLADGTMRIGDGLLDGEVIRTGAGAHAVLRLADGSRVELNQRTELFVQAAWSGETIRLERGDVLVEAAKQGRGHLRVVTRDSEATVKGTIFAVSADVAGSMVSVVQGSVAVVQPGVERLLAPGQNAATNSALAKTNVHDAVAWSDEAPKYFSILAALAKFEKDVAALPGPALRTTPKLLQYLPASALVYLAFPNLKGTIGQALSLFDQRARENATLNDWWNSTAGQQVKQTVQNLQSVTQYLGDEIVAIDTTQVGASDLTFLLAQIQPGQQEALRAALLRVAPATAMPPFRITQDLLIVASSASQLDAVAAQLGSGAASVFATQIRSRYTQGTGWLAAINVASLSQSISAANGNYVARVVGIQNAAAAFFEQRSPGGVDNLSASVVFNGARTGLASWLAAPGSAGSTEYVSTESVLMLAASTRDPRQSFDEILQLAGPELLANLQKFETETGIHISTDIAGTLGTDFTLSLERVSVPVPGFVVVAEVLQPTALDAALQRCADAYNQHLTDSSKAIAFTQETENGRTFRVLRAPGLPVAVQWTYDRGYMVASSDRALIVRAISLRDSGLSLTHSAAFRQAVPDGALHHSAYLWANVNGPLADAAALLNSPALQELAGSRTPILVVLDGETEQIRSASRTRLTSMVLDGLLTVGAARTRGANDASH